jgi:peroxiredoxin Q/BCP
MVSLDDPEKNKAFAESLEGNFPLLSDPDKTAAEAYGVLGFAGLYTKRWTFYIDSAGIIRYIDKSIDNATAGLGIVDRLKAIGFPMKVGKSADQPAAESEPGGE